MSLRKHIAAMTIVLSASCALIAMLASQSTVAGTTAAPSTQPVNKNCAVERDDTVDPAITVEYKGKIIGFCCHDCVPKFKADPEKYMKDLK